MESGPLVSVVMPVYNAEKYLAEALESVFAQTYTNLEIICVDDGSKDHSLELLRSYGTKIRLLESGGENLGIAGARNKCIREAKGALIAFMDADDIWLPTKIEKQVAYLDVHPEIAICFCHMESFISPELPEEVKALRFCPPVIPGHISAVALIRREAFDTVGLLNEQYRVGEFVDWHTRAKDAGFQSGMIDEVLFRRRIHETNTGVNERASRMDYLKIARSAIERRKATEHDASLPEELSK